MGGFEAATSQRNSKVLWRNFNQTDGVGFIYLELGIKEEVERGLFNTFGENEMCYSIWELIFQDVSNLNNLLSYLVWPKIQVWKCEHSNDK